MVSIYKLDNDFKKILLDLKPSEAEAYIDSMNAKLIETFPDINSDYWDIDSYIKLSDNLKNSIDILKTKYPCVKAYEYGSKFGKLSEKYMLETQAAFYTILKWEMYVLYSRIATDVKDLELMFYSIAMYYEHMLQMKKSLIEKETGIPESKLDKLEEYIYNKSNASFHGAEAISLFNLFIECKVKHIEESIEEIKNIPRITYEEETNDPEIIQEIIQEIDIFNFLRKKAFELVSKFEELKENPFKNYIESSVVIEIACLSSYTEEDFPNLFERKLKYLPKYDFEKFELVIPTEEGVK